MRSTEQAEDGTRGHLQRQQRKRTSKRGEKGTVRKMRESGKNGSVEAMRIDSVQEGVISSVRYQAGQSRAGTSTAVVNMAKTGLVMTWDRS